MEERLAALEHQVQLLQSNSELEIFYQKQLESVLGGTHKRTEHGVIDILTNDSIFEIKQWCLYKQAIGQLLSYSDCCPNKRLVAIFFGDYDCTSKQKVITLFSKYNITIQQVRVNPDKTITLEDV